MLNSFALTRRVNSRGTARDLPPVLLRAAGPSTLVLVTTRDLVVVVLRVLNREVLAPLPRLQVPVRIRRRRRLLGLHRDSLLRLSLLVYQLNTVPLGCG